MRAIWILAASLLAFAAHAQQTVFMPIVIEVSGNGAVSGTNFRDGALMAKFFFVQDPDGYKIEVLQEHGRYR